MNMKRQDMVPASRLEALEKVVDDVKEELRRKEGENIALLQEVQEYQKRCSVCEEKLHSMEDMYQKQIQTLKVRLLINQLLLLKQKRRKLFLFSYGT